MIKLSELIPLFEADLREHYASRLLPGHYHALNALKQCRTPNSPFMLAQCPDCDKSARLPHSCGHRSCPHCQHFESQCWLERQQQKLLPVDYFMVTFTLPAELRGVVWQHQRLFYDLLFKISWETLACFGLNDTQLKGKLGATTVLHTHSRSLDYHPHVHLIVPAGALDSSQRVWRKKRGKYLFNQNNLAKVFRAKFLQAMEENELFLPERLPEQWIVHCKQVGRGKKALTYLGKYLYRGVISENNILAVSGGKVTFRYTDNKRVSQTRTLPDADFLWLLLRHVLPKGFRRVRDYGFLHANSKALIRLIQSVFHVVSQPVVNTLRSTFQCPHCGGEMKVMATRLTPIVSNTT